MALVTPLILYVCFIRLYILKILSWAVLNEYLPKNGPGDSYQNASYKKRCKLCVYVCSYHHLAQAGPNADTGRHTDANLSQMRWQLGNIWADWCPTPGVITVQGCRYCCVIEWCLCALKLFQTTSLLHLGCTFLRVKKSLKARRLSKGIHFHAAKMF